MNVPCVRLRHALVTATVLPPLALTTLPLLCQPKTHVMLDQAGRALWRD